MERAPRPSYQLASMGRRERGTDDALTAIKYQKQNQTIHHQPYEADPILKDEEPETWLRLPVTGGSVGAFSFKPTDSPSHYSHHFPEPGYFRRIPEALPGAMALPEHQQ